MKFATYLTAIILSVVAASAVAESTGKRVGVSEFLDAIASVRADLEKGDPRHLSTHEWELWDKAAEKMHQILQGKETVEELNQDERVALHNAQEQLNAILTGDEDERVVCRRERRLGTNIRRGICVTVAELREQREAGQAAIRRMPQSVLRPGTGQ